MQDHEKDEAEDKSSLNGDFNLKGPPQLKKRNSESDIKIVTESKTDDLDDPLSRPAKGSPDRKEHPFSVPKAATTVSKQFSFINTAAADDVDLLGVTPGVAKTGDPKPPVEVGIPDLLTFDTPFRTGEQQARLSQPTPEVWQDKPQVSMTPASQANPKKVECLDAARRRLGRPRQHDGVAETTEGRGGHRREAPLLNLITIRLL